MHLNKLASALLVGLSVLLLPAACSKGPKSPLSEIKTVSKLATVEFVVRKTVYGHKDRALPLLPVRLSRASFMAFTEARIKAGINLDKLRKDDIKIEGKKISILLPPVEILNFSYPAEGFVEDTLYTDQKKFLNQITIEDQEHLFREADLSIRNEIPYLGLEEAAQRNVRQLLVIALAEAGYEEIYLEFRPSKTLTVDNEFNID